MTDHDPLAHERFRTIVSDAIDRPGMDAPYREAAPIADAFPTAYFERTVNENGVAVRRVHVVGEWEMDLEPPADIETPKPHEFVGTIYEGRHVDVCSHFVQIKPGEGYLCGARRDDRMHRFGGSE